MSSSDDRHNRAFWDADADDYQAAHGSELAATALAWGVWRHPESELGVLGDLTGCDVLELGCGAAQWSVGLRHAGVDAVGLDLSAVQLAHARRHATNRGVRLPLVQASGSAVPFVRESFDVVFADHGAFSFCPPAATVAEAARLLRPGGLLAFCASTPLLYLTWNESAGRQSDRLRRSYFELGRIPHDEGTVDHVVPTGEWIRLFRRHGLVVEDLLELRAPAGAATSFVDYVPPGWARRWPAEQIWRARKGPSARPGA